MTAALPCSVLVLALLSCTRSSESPQQASSPPAPAARAPQTAVSDAALGEQVRAFLESWLLRRDAQGAVRGRASAAFPDERFVPSGWYDPKVYRERFPASRMRTEAAISPQEFQNRLVQYVESLTDQSSPAPKAATGTGTLSAVLLPFSPEVAREVEPQLYALLAERKPRAIAVADVPALAFPVTSWSDIAWTASGTIGYRSALEEQSRSKGIAIEAVVCRLRPDSPDEPASIVVTLWSDEGATGATWRLVGLELVPQR
jgi:hypothetical protein